MCDIPEMTDYSEQDLQFALELDLDEEIDQFFVIPKPNIRLIAFYLIEIKRHRETSTEYERIVNDIRHPDKPFMVALRNIHDAEMRNTRIAEIQELILLYTSNILLIKQEMKKILGNLPWWICQLLKNSQEFKSVMTDEQKGWVSEIREEIKGQTREAAEGWVFTDIESAKRALH